MDLQQINFRSRLNSKWAPQATDLRINRDGYSLVRFVNTKLGFDVVVAKSYPKYMVWVLQSVHDYCLKL